MKKYLKLPLDLGLSEYPGQSVFYIRLRREALSDWCLGLCLLKNHLIEVLVVAEELGKHEVELQMLGKADRAANAQADFRPNTPQLKLTLTQLDYLLAFFLRYYRDGGAAVDHVDLQTTAIGTGSQDAYITVTVPDSVPPMTPEELRRRLS